MKYLIELVADASGIEPGVDALEQIEKVDKKNAEQFKKSNTEVKKYTSSLDGVAKGVKDITKAATGAFGMEAIKGADKAAQSFRSQLRQSREEITRIFVEGKATTSEIYNAARAGGALKDNIGDASQAISVLSSDTFKLDSAIQGLQVGVSIFQGLQGASALFGDENKDLQKTLVKLNAVMAISQSLQQVTNALQAQSAFRLGVTVAAQKLYTFAVGESTGALLALRTAMFALTGVGIIAGLILLVSNFEKIKGAVSGVNDQLSKNVKLAQDNLQAQKDLTSEYELQDAQAELRGVSEEKRLLTRLQNYKEDLKAIKTLKDAQDDLTKSVELSNNSRKVNTSIGGFFANPILALTSLFKKSTSDLKASKEEQTKINDEFLQAETKVVRTELELQKLRVESAKKASEEYNKLLKKQLEDEISRLETRKIENKNNAKALLNIEIALVEKKAELQKVDEKSQAKRALIDAQTIQSISDLHDKYYKEEYDRIQKNLESFAKSENIKRDEASETNKELLAELDRRKKLNAENLAKKEEELANTNRLRQEEFDAIKQYEEDKNDLISSTAIQGAQEVADFIFQIGNENRQRELQAELNALNDRKNLELANKNLTEEQKAKINAKYAAQELALKKQSFEKEKQLKIAQALINGALAVTTILSTIPPVIQAGPISVPNPAYYSSLALTALTTALSVATISRSKYAKGTEFVNGGGTETSDSVPAMLSRGERVVDAQTNKALKGIPNKMLPLLVNQSYLPSSTNISKGMDYDLLAKSFANEIRKQPLLNMSFDKNGFETFIINGKTTTYLKNSKNEF